jgi:adenine-specific DNA-methyltransferase
VERGGDKPFHTVINAENFHALKTLTFTHRGKVDAIYIDPPYNTGAKDWKYNNDYVEGDDLYRHSKWLAFMERRLLLAKELLNPRLGPDRHDRREGVPAPRPAAGADVP